MGKYVVPCIDDIKQYLDGEGSIFGLDEILQTVDLSDKNDASMVLKWGMLALARKKAPVERVLPVLQAIPPFPSTNNRYARWSIVNEVAFILPHSWWEKMTDHARSFFLCEVKRILPDLSLAEILLTLSSWREPFPLAFIKNVLGVRTEEYTVQEIKLAWLYFRFDYLLDYPEKKEMKPLLESANLDRVFALMRQMRTPSWKEKS